MRFMPKSLNTLRTVSKGFGETLIVNWLRVVFSSGTRHHPPTECSHGGCAEECWGLWDWLPEARSWTGVLQLCCSTQLETPYAAPLSCWVATPPTHTGGALCASACVCVSVCLPLLLLSVNKHSSGKEKGSFSKVRLRLDPWFPSVHPYNRLTDLI